MSTEALKEKAEVLADWITYYLPKDSALLMLKVIAALPGAEELAEELEAMDEDVPTLGLLDFDRLIDVLKEMREPEDAELVAKILLARLKGEEEEDLEEEDLEKEDLEEEDLK